MADRDAAERTRGEAEGVYSTPTATLEAARSTLASVTATAGERAEALLVLGRSAYYANRMDDSVRLLRDAQVLASEPGLVTEIVLSLAPALSKHGHPADALQLLEDPSLPDEPELAGQLLNQRGIILAELGELSEAFAQTEAALALLVEAGDTTRQTRTLVNLAVLASLMGRLDESERIYEQARELAVATEQHVVSAGIEGNLGYVASRRGDFAAALEWYARARSSFEQLGDVDLLVANLELDHARTLLEVGLRRDASDAAGRAVRSAARGGNQMLETQCQLLLGESLLAVGEHEAAARAIRRGATLAGRLGQTTWELRAAHLASELEAGYEEGEDDPLDQMARLVEAGWAREACELAIRRAQRVRADEPDVARSLLLAASELRAADVDVVDRQLLDLMLAELDDDHERGRHAFARGLEALASQRDLLGSVELRAVIAERLGTLTRVALSLAMRAPDRAEAVLDIAERVRELRDVDHRAGGREGGPDHRLERLRDARTRLEEAKVGGGDVLAAGEEVRSIERQILREARRRRGGSPARSAPSEGARPELGADTAYVSYAVYGEILIAVVRRPHARAEVVELARVDAVRRLVREQSSTMRRLTDARRARSAVVDERFQRTSGALGDALVEPLGIDGAERIVLTVPATLRNVVWGALPPMRDRPVTLTPSMRSWGGDRDPLRIHRMAFLGGPALSASGHELDAIARIWRRPDAVDPRATCASASAALERADLVHVAAHGVFRSDNPFFSAIRFSDGLLTVLDLAELGRMPQVVVLSSCDAAASTGPGGADGEVVVGTAIELRRMGARTVVAPASAVNDDAAADYSIALHAELAAGRSVDEATTAVRSRLLADDDPRRRATGAAFQVFGGRATRHPIEPGAAPAVPSASGLDEVR